MSGDATDEVHDQEPQEFEGDLAGAVFWGADLRGARFRDVDLTGARVSHARFVDVDIDAAIDAVVINGVDVTAYVNEHDRWYPLRSMLQPDDPQHMQATWAALEAEWAATVDEARRRPESALHESVDGEWSFVQTLQHVVFAIDKWFVSPIMGDPFSDIGLPNSGSADFPWPGVDQDLCPSFEDALTVHADRFERLRRFLSTVESEELERPIEVLENGASQVREALLTVFEEAFWHNRYARRDLGLP